MQTSKLACADAPGGRLHGDGQGGLGCTPARGGDSRLLVLKVLGGYKKGTGREGDELKAEGKRGGVYMLDGDVSVIICVSSVLFRRKEGRERGKTSTYPPT